MSGPPIGMTRIFIPACQMEMKTLTNLQAVNFEWSEVVHLALMLLNSELPTEVPSHPRRLVNLMGSVAQQICLNPIKLQFFWWLRTNKREKRLAIQTPDGGNWH